MAMKMFMNMKLSMMKDLSERIEKENLMTDDLKIFFEKELDEIKDNGKMMCKSMNRLNKKRANSSTTEENSDESDETTGSKKKLKKEKKEKRPPTEHQSRVSKCMVVLKERYGQVKHQIRLGTANYMASFIKDEFTNIDFDTELDKVEQALAHSIKRMNEKKNEEVYPVTPEASAVNSEESDEKKKNKKSDAVTEEPSSSMTNKKNTDKEKKKVEEKESDDEEEEEEKEVVKETKEQKKQKMDDLLKELEEMNEESDDEEDSDDEE
jgi:hypothetical protein